MGEFLNWKTLLIFIVAFIIGMLLRYFLTKNNLSTKKSKKKKAKKPQENRPQKINYGAVKGTKPNKKRKK